MSQHLQLDNPRWGFPLPLPYDRAIEHEPRAELIHEVNPAYLSYWAPDGVGRAFYFWVSCFLGFASTFALAISFLSTIYRRGTVSIGVPIGAVDIAVILVIASLPVVSAIFTCYSVRLPLQPPTYFNRTLRRVYCWHGNKNIDAGWLYIDWDKVIPVTRRIQLIHPSGSSTLYVLHLLEVNPHNDAIVKTVPVFNPQRAPEICGEMWEYIRRYMNGAAVDLPPARIDRRMRGALGLVIRLHEMAFEMWMQRDGTVHLGPVSIIFAPFMVAVSFIFIGISVWLEYVVPKRGTPPELAQASRWVGKNPYPIFESSPEEQAKLKARAIKVLPADLVLMAVSILFHGSIVALLVVASWW